jgi:hypothetical protein
MGVLEDAIREHLELKRAHGASDEEVERDETEALGPARSPAPAESDEGVEGEEAEALEQDDGELEGEPALEEEPPAAADLELEEPPAALDISDPEAESPAPADFAADFDAPPEPEPALGDRPEDFTEQADPLAEPEPPDAAPEPVFEPEPIVFDEDEPGVAPPMPEPAREPGPAPERDVPEGKSDDVLEDTPDFLQDTPDHDRLWFEQKPPRDFDFD